MLDVFKRMGRGVLLLLGENATLRYNVATKANIEHGVDTYGIDGSGNQVVYQHSIATISKDVNPKVGDRLVHPDGTFILDVLHEDNGVNQAFILRKA